MVHKIKSLVRHDTCGMLNLNAFLSDKNEISIPTHSVAIVPSWLPTKE